MLGDLKFSDSVYGFGAGVFFLGYFVFEVPSNLILHKVGARVWICRVLVTWGSFRAVPPWCTPRVSFTPCGCCSASRSPGSSPA